MCLCFPASLGVKRVEFGWEGREERDSKEALHSPMGQKCINLDGWKLICTNLRKLTF
jgi:hypothetical protein